MVKTGYRLKTNICYQTKTTRLFNEGFYIFSTQKVEKQFFFERKKAKVPTNIFHLFFRCRGFSNPRWRRQDGQKLKQDLLYHRCSRAWVVWNCGIMVRPFWQRQILSATRGRQVTHQAMQFPQPTGFNGCVFSGEFSRDLIQGLFAFYVQICLILRDSGWLLCVLFFHRISMPTQIAALNKHQHSENLGAGFPIWQLLMSHALRFPKNSGSWDNNNKIHNKKSLI